MRPRVYESKDGARRMELYRRVRASHGQTFGPLPLTEAEEIEAFGWRGVKSMRRQIQAVRYNEQSMKRKNAQVFPSTISAGGQSITDGGMTLRDYFAAKAMQGIEANPNRDLVRADHILVAAWAYDIADAMLDFRKEKKHEG